MQALDQKNAVGRDARTVFLPPVTRAGEKFKTGNDNFAATEQCLQLIDHQRDIQGLEALEVGPAVDVSGLHLVTVVIVERNRYRRTSVERQRGGDTVGKGGLPRGRGA